jgi:PPOX class probable F420-dependent enzyme
METETTQMSAHVARRLEHEYVIWLTTTGVNGEPQPNPVWFYWDGSCFLVYTTPIALKLKNIARNPKVSLHFEGADVMGGDVIVFHGNAEVVMGEGVHPGYARKYLAAAEEWGRTSDELYKEYSVLIRIRPSRIRVS